jgi:endonuclease/exonuclease/phosphatase family metal-dependent hydrolase
MSSVAGLLGYAIVVADDPQVVDGARYYSAAEQKVALMYRPDLAIVTHAELILTEAATDFGGRPPLHVDVTLRSGVTLGIVVVHFKAFADADGYARRTRAALALDAWLDARPATEKLAVVGDWNDDIDVSIYEGKETPLAPVVADAPAYTFVTAALSARGLSSTVHGNAFIDHHLLSAALRAHVTETPELVRADAWVPDCADTTSDHWPVLTHLRRGQPRVVIDQVQAGPGGFVQLYNPEKKPLALRGWKLFDGEAARVDFENEIIAPHDVLVVRGDLALDAGGDAVTVRDDAGALIDQVTFGPTNGALLARSRSGDATSPLIAR